MGDRARDGDQPAPEARAPKPILNELSQLAFTVRIIEEAEDEANPLAARLRFVAIASANLQEYFMTHFAGLDRSVSVGPDDAESSTRFRAPQVRRYVARETNDLRRQLMAVWTALRGAALDDHGLTLRELDELDELDEPAREQLAERFEIELAPALRACATRAARPRARPSRCRASCSSRPEASPRAGFFVEG